MSGSDLVKEAMQKYIRAGIDVAVKNKWAFADGDYISG